MHTYLQNATKLKYYDIQISELLGVLNPSPRLFWYTLNLEQYSLEVIIIIYTLNSTIRLTNFLLHNLIQALYLI